MEYSPDTIRILVSTDNHVGYGEGEGVRTNDSWRTFDEVLSLARAHDVDMVLLAGDLFHENHPSRKSMMEVMKSLRTHCLGDKPCSVEIVGDQSEHFPGLFNHANYMDPDINVSIPVFSIHGNHDDPTGADHTAALDLLHTAGLLNYYGHILEVDKIQVKPILMQKGDTKLALYGLSNVRDERLFQTFKDHNVTFFNPTQSREEWYNILSVHQNHTAHTDSSYLPESSLPDNMDLVIWGHEHECRIDPRLNPEMGFKVMQPGSTVATSLIPGEAIPKHVAILNITGKECKVETIRLKSVRPFVYRDIVLRDDKEMAKVAHKSDNLTEVKEYCKDIIEEMLEEAKEMWLAQHPDDEDEMPLPLIRLRVEYTAPEGGEFKVEQNQRFSQEYQDRVANTNDVVNFHRRRQTAARKVGGHAVMPDAKTLKQLEADNVKVAELVREFLGAQALTMLPQNLFSDAVIQFVDKNDKSAMGLFVQETLKMQVDNLIVDGADESDDDTEDKILQAMSEIKTQQEDRFRKGEIKARSNEKKLRPKPITWDSDQDGPWSECPAAQLPDEQQANGENGEIDYEDDDYDGLEEVTTSTRGRGTRGRGRGGRATTTKAKKAPTKPAAKSRAKKKPIEEDSDEDNDIIMIDDDEEEDNDNSGGLFVSQASSAPRSVASRTNGSRTAATKSTKTAKQSTLSFATQASSTAARTAPARPTQAKAARRHEPSEDEIDDDDDAFEPVVPTRTRRR